MYIYNPSTKKGLETESRRALIPVSPAGVWQHPLAEALLHLPPPRQLPEQLTPGWPSTRLGNTMIPKRSLQTELIVDGHCFACHEAEGHPTRWAVLKLQICSLPRESEYMLETPPYTRLEWNRQSNVQERSSGGLHG